MSDRMRTALKGGGSISILIEMSGRGDFSLRVTESWARLTAVERRDIPAAELAEKEDPDAALQDALTQLVRKAHINWEAGKDRREIKFVRIRITKGNPEMFLREGDVFCADYVKENATGEPVYFIRHAGALIGIAAAHCEVIGTVAPR